MANTTIPNLPPVIALNGTEQIPAVQGGVSVQITTKQIAGYALSASGSVQTLNKPSVVNGATYSQGPYDASLIFTTSGTCTMTLLSPSVFPGQFLYIKIGTTGTTAVSSASNNIVPLGAVAASNTILTTSGKFAILQSDGTYWQILAQG